MMTEKELRVIRQAEKRFAKSKPSTWELVKLASEYAKASARLSSVHDDAEKMRSLDEWDPKHTAWERRLYRAECQRDVCRAVLLAAARTMLHV